MSFQLRELTLNFVIGANLPFSIVENKDFISFSSYISNNQAKLPARKTLVTDLIAQSNNIKRELIKIIDENDYICTTADVLTKRAKSYLGMTIHLFDENLTKQSFMLAFRRLKGRHTHDKLAEVILEIHREFNLKRSKITHIVTDGGSNFCKAFRIFGDQSDKNDDEIVINTDNTSEDHQLEVLELDIETILGPEDVNEEVVENVIGEILNFDSNVDNFSYFHDDYETLPKQMRCKSHTLNLIGSGDFEKEIKKEMNKCYDAFESAYNKLKSFWNLSSRSTVAKEIIQSICKRLFPHPSNIRWNGKFDCIEIAVEHRNNINIAIEAINKEAEKHASNRRKVKRLEKITPADWRCLQDYINILRPVAVALDILQGEKRACQGYIMPSIFSIMANVRNCTNFTSEYGRVMHKCMINCLERRFGDVLKFDEENNDLILAAVVHPNFKLSWIEKESDKEYAQSLFINKYISFAQKSQHSHDTEEIEAPVEKQKSKENVFFQHIRQNERRTSTDDTLTMEIWKYILQPISDDVVVQTNQLKSLPILEKMFRLYNTTLSSSAPVERLFSNASLIFTPHRNRISDEHFEQALFVRRNSKLLNGNCFV